MEPLFVVCTVLVVFAVALQGALMAYDWRDRRAMLARMRAVRLPVAGVSVADLSGMDLDAPQPLVQMPHSHVWGPQPESEDISSRTYHCQVPRCPRIHTVMR